MSGTLTNPLDLHLIHHIIQAHTMHSVSDAHRKPSSQGLADGMFLTSRVSLLSSIGPL